MRPLSLLLFFSALMASEKRFEEAGRLDGGWKRRWLGRGSGDAARAGGEGGG